MRSRLSTMVKLAVVGLVVVLPFLGCFAAIGQTPDSRGEVRSSSYRYQGTRANAPIPAELHQRNSRGIDGNGLCVIASLVTNLRYQGVPEHILQRLWQTALERPGGYSPDKLERLLREIMPDAQWISYYGADVRVLSELSAKGLPIGATMSWGQGYPGMIHHMVSLIHYEQGKLACVVDNNDPGMFHWMPASEYDRRWFDGPYGWAVAFLPQHTVKLVILAAALLLLLVPFIVVVLARSLVSKS